ncbi:hypothetical protein N8Z51_01865 [Pelagibacteraceae bacterium]|nr:hypothetical protein [Pelagibacteraceae bacterium]
MKKIIFLLIIFFGSTLLTSAAEKKNCSDLKKYSKTYFACKTGNLKTGIINTGSKVKKGTVSKVKNFKTTLNNPFKKKN